MSKSMSLFSALLCTFIWGTTFIAQDTGMDKIGPLTFNGTRFFIGFLSNKKTKGATTKKPTKKRTELKVNGPMLSIPVSWAINVVPQIKVHKKALSKDIGLDMNLDC